MTLSGLGGLLLVFGLVAQNSGELGHVSEIGKLRQLAGWADGTSRNEVPCTNFLGPLVP